MNLCKDLALRATSVYCEVGALYSIRINHIVFRIYTSKPSEVLGSEKETSYSAGVLIFEFKNNICKKRYSSYFWLSSRSKINLVIDVECRP